MAQSSVIREFLVKLGFVKDEKGLKDFQQGVKSATKAVFGLATAIEATAIAIAVGVARWSSNLEQLYFASQRTKSSASNLQAFSQAAQNFGASAGEAMGAVEGLAHSIRVNVGNASLIEGLGVHLKDAKGNARDMVDVMQDLGRVFRSNPMFRGDVGMNVAEQFAEQLGINEHTLLAMMNGGFDKELDKQHKAIGKGFDKSVIAAHHFEMQIRSLKMQLDLLGLTIYDSLVKQLGLSIPQIQKWLQENGPALAKSIAETTKRIMALAEAIAKHAKSFISNFMAIDHATGGWLFTITAVTAALRIMGGPGTIGMIAKLGTALLTALGPVGKVLAGVGALYAMYEYVQSKEADFNAQRGDGDLHPTWGALAMDKLFPAERTLDQNMMQRLGLNAAQAKGIFSRLNGETAFDPEFRGSEGEVGIAGFSAAQQARYKAMKGRDIRTASRWQQIDFLTTDIMQNYPELVAGLKGAQSADESSRRLFLGYQGGIAPLGRINDSGGKNVSVSQKTDIHVHGVSDPAAAAHKAVSAQSRVNAQVTRNLAAAVQ